MSCPKFCVGDRVEVDYLPYACGEIRGYKIIRLVPYRGSEPLYRIKSSIEPFERIVRECELAPAARSPAIGTDASFTNAQLALSG
jgi:hypothetical protein